jgi:cysteine desulfurase
VKSYLFFDYASTTKCCEAAAEMTRRFAVEEFGNPSSSHVLGQVAARSIRDARIAFSKVFNITPEQIIFTGSGTEADNLAVSGITLGALAKNKPVTHRISSTPVRVIISATEHSAVKMAAKSMTDFGVDIQVAPVDSYGQIIQDKFLELLTPSTALISIHQVNNIIGSLLPVEELARISKERVPTAIFHSDAVQAFGKVNVPTFPSAIDLVSISGHKIEGPKGVGALIVLNKDLLNSGLRPLIWGGNQEGGFRSGTQNAGLIAGFQLAAEQVLEKLEINIQYVWSLRKHFEELLRIKMANRIHINSPDRSSLSIPHIISLSVPGVSPGPLARLLEERGCIVSTGSACSSHKPEPEPVLAAMGLPAQIQNSAIRISFSRFNKIEELNVLVQALDESIQHISKLLGDRISR